MSPSGTARSNRPAEPPGVPRRTCVGCRRVRHQGELRRVGRLPGGDLATGRTLPGRGAWLCRDTPTCLERAIRTGGFARAFRAPVSPEQLTGLRHELAVPPEPPSHFVPGPPPARD